ncbi:MAG TPA: hypothetical protein VJ385_02645 [Fibrobacteria bacterium]|nr:hypothetical protein [Fibrobacteria bacterium]
MNRMPMPVAAALVLLASGCDKTAGDAPAGAAAFRPVFASSPEEVRAFFAAGGGGRAKLAFVDRTGDAGSLCFVDFSEASPRIRVIAAAVDPKVPVISPDGDWITYASGPGAEAGSSLMARSSAYLVRMEEGAKPLLLAADSACEPRFVQNAESGKLAVLYTTLSPNLGWEGFGRTLKMTLDVSGASPIKGAVETVSAGGSYTGGLSYDGSHLCGGGGHVAMLDLRRPDARPETLSHNLVQACNASVSSSRIFTDAVMYLNSPKDSDPSLNGGKPWGEWQAILIGGGSVPRGIRKGFLYPLAFARDPETVPPSVSAIKWHHAEWSNHPYFAAATLNVDRYFRGGGGIVNANLQERIYFINLRDSAYLEALRPDTLEYRGRSSGGFFWPWLWVEVPEGFRERDDWLEPRT